MQPCVRAEGAPCMRTEGAGLRASTTMYRPVWGVDRRLGFMLGPVAWAATRTSCRDLRQRERAQTSRQGRGLPEHHAATVGGRGLRPRCPGRRRAFQDRFRGRGASSRIGFVLGRGRAFHASQRGSLSRPQAMMVGSSRYRRPFTVLRRSSAWRAFWRYSARAPGSVKKSAWRRIS